jgi:hypothetical protein
MRSTSYSVKFLIEFIEKYCGTDFHIITFNKFVKHYKPPGASLRLDVADLNTNVSGVVEVLSQQFKDSPGTYKVIFLSDGEINDTNEAIQLVVNVGHFKDCKIDMLCIRWINGCTADALTMLAFTTLSNVTSTNRNIIIIEPKENGSYTSVEGTNEESFNIIKQFFEVDISVADPHTFFKDDLKKLIAHTCTHPYLIKNLINLIAVYSQLTSKNKNGTIVYHGMKLEKIAKEIFKMNPSSVHRDSFLQVMANITTNADPSNIDHNKVHEAHDNLIGKLNNPRIVGGTNMYMEFIQVGCYQIRMAVSSTKGHFSSSQLLSFEYVEVSKLIILTVARSTEKLYLQSEIEGPNGKRLLVTLIQNGGTEQNYHFGCYSVGVINSIGCGDLSVIPENHPSAKFMDELLGPNHTHLKALTIKISNSNNPEVNTIM